MKESSRLYFKIRNFGIATSGSVAIWAALSMPFVIGGGALSVDMSRIYNMDNELQSASDALSKAGAAELDQRSDSLVRASRAIERLVSNDQDFQKMASVKSRSIQHAT